MKQQSGTSFLELVVSLLIFSYGLLSYAYMQGMALRFSHLASKQNQIDQTQENRLEASYEK